MIVHIASGGKCEHPQIILRGKISIWEEAREKRKRKTYIITQTSFQTFQNKSNIQNFKYRILLNPKYNCCISCPVQKVPEIWGTNIWKCVQWRLKATVTSPHDSKFFYSQSIILSHLACHSLNWFQIFLNMSVKNRSPHIINCVIVWNVHYLPSNLPQEIKDFFDVAGAFLPTADNLLPPHLGSNVTVNSYGIHNNSLHFFYYIFLHWWNRFRTVNIGAPHEAGFDLFSFFTTSVKKS